MSEQKNDTLDNLDYSIGSLDLDDLTADKPAGTSDLDALFAEDHQERSIDSTSAVDGIDADFLSQLDDMSDLGTLEAKPQNPSNLPENEPSALDDLMDALDDIPVASHEQKITSTFEEESTTQSIPDPALLAGSAAAATMAAAKSEKPKSFFAKLFGKKEKAEKPKNQSLFGKKKTAEQPERKSRLGKLKATTGIGKPKPDNLAVDELQDLPNDAADSAPIAKKPKGFFSGRFGKKETPISGTTFDTQEKSSTIGLGDMPDELVNNVSKPADSKGSKFKAFGATKNNKASKTKLTSGAKSGNGNKKSNALLIAGLACALAIAGAGYVFLTGDDSAAPNPTVSAPPQPTVEQPMDPSLQNMPADTQDPMVATNDPAAAPQNNGMPSTNQGINPDEILNAQVPSDPALVKEEIDRLSDTNSRLKEQGKIAEDQLQVMEKLTTAKAEQIALLEKQIAELEKQKNDVVIPPPQGATNPPPAGQ